MNFGGNGALDQADLRAEQERETSIAAASAAVSLRGRMICQDCPSKISDERRAAAPFARRCIECQETYELEHRHK